MRRRRARAPRRGPLGVLGDGALLFLILTGTLFSFLTAFGAAVLSLPLLLGCAVLLLCAASFTGIFCLLSMLCTNRAVAAVLAVLLAMGLLMCSSYMLNALNQPEFQQGMVMTEAGLQLSEPTPNPSYVGGMKREVFQFLSDTLPSGQSISVCSYELNRPVFSLASSVVIAVLSSAVGMIFFKRKDLR